ncbi:MAG: hypothetical protein WC528_05190 [Patescibacteria group bacterium]
MFSTSKDVLLWVLSVCLAFFTFFLCWALYLMIKMLREGNKAMEMIKEKIEAFSDLMLTIKEKIVNSATSLNTMASAVSKVIEFFKERKDKKKKKKSDEDDF